MSLTVVACSSSTAHPSAAAAYLAIAAPANTQLDRAFDAFTKSDQHNLAGSITDLRAISQIEREFDRHLLRLTLTVDEEQTAQALVASNESRAKLTARAASSTTLTELRAIEPQLTAANQPVEADVRTLRHQLGLPPPDTD